MYFKLSSSQEDFLLHQPETGMGYQILEAEKTGSHSRGLYLALNSELIIEINDYEDSYVWKVINEGINKVKLVATQLTLNSIKVLNEKQFCNLVSESKSDNEKGAIGNPVENADGIEIFVRLSAFDNDRRVDKINKRLLPGSFMTTAEDFLACKSKNDDPVERFVLPDRDAIKFIVSI